jgi:aspartyl-tRNA(Asn)/glutamyl-tRNA(Gln) amidotransferase subunit B
MSNTKDTYALTCGLEVHAELKTLSKMFCGCKNDPFFAPGPNTHTCPVCLGMPGALPVANKTAIEWAIKLGLALNCKINLFSKFDRKNYFYPDLPKGYQISQYDIPFCYDGFIETPQGKIRIRRIHLEEDTGKLQHTSIDGEKVSLIDYNRSGVPLIEIVTEPDIVSASQAKEYGKQLRQIIRFLDIGDCDMEQGGMRLEANVSLRPATSTELANYKVEVKNINSFRFLEQAIEFEMKRQAKILDGGEIPAQETRGWNPDKNQTFSQRTKEEAEDYRYFPDPDIPPLRFTQAQIDAWRAELPELPEAIVARWQVEYRVEERFSQMLVSERADAEWHEQLWQLAKTKSTEPNKLASALTNKKLARQSDQAATLAAYQAANQTATVDEGELSSIIEAVMVEFPDETARLRGGDTKLINFFIGQIMRKIGKKVDMALINAQIAKTLMS